jgi:hypothetical protein
MLEHRFFNKLLNLTNHFLLLCSPFVRILPPFTTISITVLRIYDGEERADV